MTFLLRTSLPLLCWLSLACGNAAPEKVQTNVPIQVSKQAAKQSFATGKIIESVTLKANASQSFALYLPSTYSDTAIWPTLYFFDAQAEGTKPLELYQELAETYGYILIGSNYSQNGLQPAQYLAHAKALFQETAKLFTMSSTHQFAMGFSGGATVATQLAATTQNLTGVISCGSPNQATLPSNRTIDHIGLVGIRDFNFVNAFALQQAHQGSRSAGFMPFNGIHEWAPAHTLTCALMYLELQAFNRGIELPNQRKVVDWIAFGQEALDNPQEVENKLAGYDLAQLFSTILASGKLQAAELDQSVSQHLTDSKHQKILQERRALLDGEKDLQALHAQNLQKLSLEQWNTLLQTQEDQFDQETYSEAALQWERLKGYLSLMSYMYTTNAITQQQWPAANHYVKLYQKVDPTNPEAFYLQAKVAARTQQPSVALKALEQSISLGFNDAKRLANDVDLQPLRNRTEFPTIPQN